MCHAATVAQFIPFLRPEFSLFVGAFALFVYLDKGARSAQPGSPGFWDWFYRVRMNYRGADDDLIRILGNRKRVRR